jgi:MFS family permease
VTKGTLESIVELPVPLQKLDQYNLRSAWWGVVFVFLVHGLVVSTWVSRIAAVKANLRLSDAALGLALLGAALGSMATIPICGWAVGRYGSRAVVLTTAFGFASSLLFLGGAFSLVTLTAALVFYGAMAGANDVAINAHAVEIEKRLGRPTMSRFHAMFSLGGIIGSALGGWIAWAGYAPSIHFVLAVIIICCVIAAVRILTIQTNPEPAEYSRLSLRRPPLALLALSIIGFCIFLSEGAIADWTAVYLRQILHAGEGTAAAGYAFFSASMTVFRFTGDAITLRLGRAWTIRGGALLAGCGLAIVALANSPAMALAGFATAGAGFSSIIPVVFAAGGRISGVGEGVGVATVSGIGYLGFIVGPPAIGFISEATSLRGGLSLLVVLCIFAALLVSAVQRTAREGSNPLA